MKLYHFLHVFNTTGKTNKIKQNKKNDHICIYIVESL